MSQQLFAERDAILKLIGFESYEQYLASDLWHWIRCSVLRSIDDKCECCLTTSGLCLHHRDYSLPVLCGNFSNVHRKIVRVCNECHLAIHSDGKQWFDMQITDERFQVLVGRAPLVSRGGFDRSELPVSVEKSEFDEWVRYLDSKMPLE